jgi:hypothetical protein
MSEEGYMKALLTGLGIGMALGVLLAPRRGDLSFVRSRKLARERSTSFSPAHEEPGRSRDPEERSVNRSEQAEIREKMLDKTLADSFPTSDPPSSIPDPSEDDSLIA